MANNKIDLSAGMVPHGYSALPAPVRRVLSSTGLQLKPGSPHVGAQNMPAIASVDAGSPNTINVEDPQRFKQSGPQTLGHEAVHIGQNNWTPEMQAQIPPDDPRDPYNYGGTDGLKSMRDQGKKLWNLPREKAATVVQYYISQGADKAPQHIRDAYEPWVKDLNDAPLSTIVPSEPDQQGLNTTARAPQGQMYSTQTFAKGDSAPGEMPTHEAGEVTAWDSASGLPIVKRKPASKPSDPDEKEETTETKPAAKAIEKPGEDSNEKVNSTASAKPADKPAEPAKGAPVKLQDGTTGKIVWLDPKLGIARIKTDDGKKVSVRKGAFTVQPHTQVAAHVRKLPGK